MGRGRGMVAAGLLAVSFGCGGDPVERQRAYLDRADQFLAADQHQEAIVEYRNALRIDERSGAVRAKLAEAYVRAGDARNALRESVRAADLLPDDLDVQMRAAALLALAGRLDDARTRVDAVLARDPLRVAAHTLLGGILAGQRDMEAAVAQIEEAIQVDPTRSGSYTSMGVLRLAQGERAAAEAAFRKAVEVDPTSVDAQLGLAMFQLQTGEPGAAEATLRDALAIDPAHAQANRVMAVLYLASNRAAGAEGFLKTFVAASGSDAARFMLADYYVAMRRPADATTVLASLAEQEATAADAHVRLAEMELSSDRAAAHARLDDVLARHPAHVRALLAKSSWLLLEGDRNEALARAEQAVEAAPEHAPAHYLRGLVQAEQQDFDAAAASFNEVLRLNPRAAAAQLQLARLRLARGEAGEAVAFAESALANAPDSADVRLTLARSLIAQRDLARADAITTELLQEFPSAAAVHALAGALHLARGDVAEARAAYERAFTFDPGHHPALAGLTALDLLAQQTDSALRRVDARLARRADDAPVLMLAAFVYLQAGDPARAERALRRVIELTPADTRAYGMLGQLYISQRRHAEARAEFDTVATRDPGNVPARTIAAMISHGTSDLEDAKRRYREILEREPRAAVAANNLAWILAEEGRDLDEALRLARRAVAEAPNQPEIHHTLGWVYYRHELPALAVPAFERSIEQAPDNPAFHYHLALAHHKMGNAAEARRAVDATLALDPGHAEAIALSAALR